MIVLNGNGWYSPAVRQDERSNNLRDICATAKQVCLNLGNAREALSEEDRSHHQAIQARRG
jgi:hypothetical protein